jgi:hypothetical protein
MSALTPTQQAIRERLESVIGVAAPFLDLVLAVGERISRAAEPTDHEYYPIRSGERVILPGEAGEEASEERAAQS